MNVFRSLIVICVVSAHLSSCVGRPEEISIAGVTVEAPRMICPRGWVSVSGELPTCQPFPEGAHVSCPPGTARFIGDDACGPIGSPCGTSIWPSLPSNGNVIYVAPHGRRRATGTPDDPFSSIEEAMLYAPPGTVIALSRGRHVGGVAVETGVTLVGACAAETIVEVVPGIGYDAALVAFGTDIGIRDLTITGDGVGIAVNFGASAQIEGVAVEGAILFGVSVGEGGNALIRRSTIRGTRNRTVEDVTTSMAVFVSRHATLEADQIIVEGNAREGISSILENTSTRVHRAIVRGSHGSAGITSGHSLELSESVIDGFPVGLLIDKGVADIRDTRIMNGGGNADGLASGAWVGATATASFLRVLVEDQAMAGIFGEGEISITDSVVREIRAGPAPGSSGTEMLGVGIGAHDGARVSLARVALRDIDGIGVFAVQDCSLQLVDLDIDRMRPVPNGKFARGVGVELSSIATGERVSIRNTREFGVSVLTGSAARLTHVWVHDTDESACMFGICEAPEYGDGIAVADGSYLELWQFEILRSTRSGVAVIRAEVDLHHGLIESSPAGVVLDNEGFDERRLRDHVVYRADRNLVRLSLRSPETVLPEGF